MFPKRFEDGRFDIGGRFGGYMLPSSTTVDDAISVYSDPKLASDTVMVMYSLGLCGTLGAREVWLFA
jgi:hypothetical protein